MAAAAAAAAGVDTAALVLRRGGLVAFPTETVYGLGADATNRAAVARIFTVKGRPGWHPLIVHLSEPAAVKEWAAEVPPDASALAEAFWPGPLTLVLRRSDLAPDVVTGGLITVGLRVPAQPLALELLSAFGGGVAAPSANRFGRVSPTTADHVRADLGDEVDFVLDGGPCRIGVESTIVDCSAGTPEVLRVGGVPLEALAEVLGHAVPVRHAGPGSPGSGPVSGPGSGAERTRVVRAPGTLERHYAPRAQVEVLPPGSVAERAAEWVAAGRRVGVLAPGSIPGLPAGVEELPPAGDVDAYARCLYDRLREADRRGLDVLVAVPPSEAGGLAAAVSDRLRRAAATGE